MATYEHLSLVTRPEEDNQAPARTYDEGRRTHTKCTVLIPWVPRVGLRWSPEPESDGFPESESDGAPRSDFDGFSDLDSEGSPNSESDGFPKSSFLGLFCFLPQPQKTSLGA